jgi:putative ABC transport system permease protein
MHSVLDDVRFALSHLARTKTIALAVVLIVGAGIGANTAVFGLFKATFDSRPFPEMERLVRVHAVSPRGGDSSAWISIPEYSAIEDQSRVFEGVSAMDDSVFTLGAVGESSPAERVAGQRFKASMLRVLGVQPQLGRGFAAGEDREGELVPLAIISDRLWRTRFAERRDVIDDTILIDNVRTRIVGVMPARFSVLDEVDVWIPQTFNAAQLQGSTRFLTAIARLRPAVSLEQAQADMNRVAARLGELYPRSNSGWGIRLEPLDGAYYAEARRTLLIMQVAVALILLIACANVAGLLLVQAAGRRREVGTRLALGAGRIRLLRSCLVESLLLAAAGGVVGLAVASLATTALTRLTPQGLSRVGEVTIDAPILTFALLVSVASGLFFGLIPAWQLSRADSASLQELGRGVTGDRRTARLQSALVTGQIALTLVLLVAAGLVLKSYVRLQRAPLGVDPTGVMSFDTVLSRAQYLKMTGARINGFGEFQLSPIPSQVFDRVAQRLRDIQGVVSAAGISSAPFSGQALEVPLTILDGPVQPTGAVTVHYQLVTPGFFETMDVPIRRGRDITSADRADAPWVAVINEAMAERFWPGQDPIGRRIRLDAVPDERPREVVAVVGNTPLSRWERASTPMLYLPHAQQLLTYRAPYGGMRLQMTFVMRINEHPDTIVRQVRRAVAEVDPAAPVANAQMLDEFLIREIASPRFYMLTTGLFAASATVLAILGIYGVLAYTVAQRKHEIAVRIALGATPRAITTLVVRHAVWLTTSGIAIGLVVSLLVTPNLASLLWDVTPTDPSIFAAVVLLLTLVALSVCVLPAYRARRVNAGVVLTHT